MEEEWTLLYTVSRDPKLAKLMAMPGRGWKNWKQSWPNLRVHVAKFMVGHTPNPERACRVQISMHVRGRTLRAEVKGPNVLRAIDAAIEKMERQIDRFKGRYRRNRRAKKEAYASMPVSTEVVDETDLEMWDERGFVVREKEFKVAALPVAEAVEAMEQLEHDFHVFLNEETGDLNVVYRRQSGNYGLLKPQKGGV